MFPAGLLSFPLTPFTHDSVDLDAFGAHLEDQLAQGPDGVFVAAGTGEYTSLSPAEHAAVLARAVAIVRGKVPVFTGVGGGIQNAKASAAVAEAAGVDGILLLPPYLVESPPAGLLGHIREVAAATRKPVVVYHRSNAILDAGTAVQLLDIPNVVALKDGTGDIERLQRIVATIRTSGHPRAESFHFQNGQPTAELSARAYRAVGAHSYSSAVLNFAPDIARAFYAAYTGRDEARMDAILAAFYLPFARIRDRSAGYAVSLVKAGARLRGLPVGSVRPPLRDPVAADVDELEQLIATARKSLGTTATAPGVPAAAIQQVAAQ